MATYDHLLGDSQSGGPYGPPASTVFAASAQMAESIARSAASAVLASSSNPQVLAQNASVVSKALQFKFEGLPDDLRRKVAAATSELERDVETSLRVADKRDKCLEPVRSFEELNIYPKQLDAFQMQYDSPELHDPCPQELRNFTVAIPVSSSIKDARKQLHEAYQIHVQKIEASILNSRLARMREKITLTTFKAKVVSKSNERRGGLALLGDKLGLDLSGSVTDFDGISAERAAKLYEAVMVSAAASTNRERQSQQKTKEIEAAHMTRLQSCSQSDILRKTIRSEVAVMVKGSDQRSSFDKRVDFAGLHLASQEGGIGMMDESEIAAKFVRPHPGLKAPKNSLAGGTQPRSREQPTGKA